MRVLVVLTCLAALAAPTAHAAASTELTITYLENSARPREKVRWTLRCDPAGGTHPRRVAVCRELGRIGWKAFAPLPPGTACAAVYGGPQAAIVAGHVGGHRVWARLTRIDGCQIARWARVPSLLPPGGGPLSAGSCPDPTEAGAPRARGVPPAARNTSEATMSLGLPPGPPTSSPRL